MDSYRPGQAPDERDDSAHRREEVAASAKDHQRSRDYDRSYDRTYDRREGYDQQRRRGSHPHDSRHQEYAYGSRYADHDRDDRRGGRRYDTQRMEYDDDYESEEYKIPARNDFNRSDILRHNAELEKPQHGGEKDKGPEDKPNRFLLIRGIKSTLSEELLAKGLEKLYRGADDLEGGARPMSLRSVMTVKVRRTDERMSYCFAEFYTVEDAIAARKKSQALGQWCTISSQTFEADIPRGDVFPPASMSKGPIIPKFTFTMWDSGGRAHIYRDERCYADVHIINTDPPEGAKDLKGATKTTASTVQTGSKRGVDTLESQPSKPKKAKKTADAVIIPDLQKWQKKGAELRAEPESETERAISEPQSSDEQSFAVATERDHRCYLCNTKLKTSETLKLHLQQSETHVAFAKDEKRRAKGFERLEKNGIDPTSTVKIPAPQAAAASSAPPAPGQQQPELQYRDRASERRQDQAASPAAAKVKVSLKGAAAAKPAVNRGREMMKGLGWTEGQGLGDGSGVSAPIEQSMYAAGVGLGHEGSLRGDAVAEAERRTKDERGDFLEQTKENARKRYERM